MPKAKKRYYYEPKCTPIFDDKGNPVGYKYPRALACPLQDSDDIRVKVWPNELGLSADPENVTGFRALVDLINQNRNLSGNPIFFSGADDAMIMSEIQHNQALAKEILSQN